MIAQRFNIIITGVHLSGRMASSQRARNLFRPLLNREDILIKNLVVNETKNHENSSEVLIYKLKYNIRNPFSILFFIYKSIRYFSENFKKDSENIIYHYGYPSIENIISLKFSKLIGYKVVFDIVENITFFDNYGRSSRLKFKNFTSKILLDQIYKTGSLCFGISFSLVDFCRKISGDKIPVAYLPVSVDVDYVRSFKNDRFKISTEPDESLIKVFYGGSFGFKDGFEYLIKGFEMACKLNDRIELTLTGTISKQTKGAIERLICNSGSRNRIKYLGCLSEEDYYSAMTNCDILCVPRVNTAYANSGFPFKLGEYLASGNAVITTNVGEVSRYLKNKWNAIIISPESESEICDAIIMLAADKEMRTRIGKEGVKTAIEYFSSCTVSSILWDSISKLN